MQLLCFMSGSRLISCCGIFLHGNGLFVLNRYRIYLTLGVITSKQSGAYALLSGRRWAGTHFSRPHFIGAWIWSVCPGSRSSRSRFTFTGILKTQKAVPPALTLIGGARFIAWRLRRHFLGECRRGPWHLGGYQACLCYSSAPGPT